MNARNGSWCLNLSVREQRHMYNFRISITERDTAAKRTKSVGDGEEMGRGKTACSFHYGYYMHTICFTTFLCVCFHSDIYQRKLSLEFFLDGIETKQQNILTLWIIRSEFLVSIWQITRIPYPIFSSIVSLHIICFQEARDEGKNFAILCWQRSVNVC